MTDELIYTHLEEISSARVVRGLHHQRLLMPTKGTAPTLDMLVGKVCTKIMCEPIANLRHKAEVGFDCFADEAEAVRS